MKEVARLQSQLADVLRTYVRNPGDNGTALLRRAAEITVAMRARFDHDGGPDWRGRTYAYRTAMSETYGMAGILPEETKRVRDAGAWHVGEVLREKVDAETLADLGFRDARPKERSAERHERERAVLTASVAKRFDSAPKIVAGATAALAKLKAEAVDKLSAVEREELVERLAELRRQADRLERLVMRRLES